MPRAFYTSCYLSVSEEPIIFKITMSSSNNDESLQLTKNFLSRVAFSISSCFEWQQKVLCSPKSSVSDKKKLTLRYPHRWHLDSHLRGSSCSRPKAQQNNCLMTTILPQSPLVNKIFKNAKVSYHHLTIIKTLKAPHSGPSRRRTHVRVCCYSVHYLW